MDSYVYLITALFPLAAAMVVLQSNPYRALIVRGILGAIAALVYTIYGAADVALTEALVGTLLAITLYAIAIRSSLVLRLGWVRSELDRVASPQANRTDKAATDPDLEAIIADLRTAFDRYYLRVELVPYADDRSLKLALQSKDVHAIYQRSASAKLDTIVTRLPRLQEIMSERLTTAHVELAKPLDR